ncbi:MAG: ATP-binding protein [Acidimicrobiales bacterium]
MSDVNILDLLPDAVLVVDAGFRITAANAAAARLTKRRATEMVGGVCTALLDPRDRAGRPALERGWHPSSRLRAVRGLAEQVVTLRCGDRGHVTVLATATYLRDPSGGLAGAIFCLRDAARGVQAPVSGIEVVSTVSHELRSPLTSVKGFTSLLLNRWDRLDDGQKRMMLEQVYHDADRVTRLIGELLDISRLESGRLVLHRQLVDLARLAGAVVDKVRLEYPQLDAAIDFPDRFPKVYADPDKVEQVVTNLVENACKYASPAGIVVRGRATPAEVHVSVVDEGEGIAPSDLPKVFTKFFRQPLGRPTGSGLGLWISRGLVEAHGGRLSVESEAGKGSTFMFSLPVVDLDRLQGS